MKPKLTGLDKLGALEREAFEMCQHHSVECCKQEFTIIDWDDSSKEEKAFWRNSARSVHRNVAKAEKKAYDKGYSNGMDDLEARQTCGV